ncbi:hypothetical protein [Crateriforma conspicua]|uniref:Uncharacterized protein n=1 Tax=Crateriforma conspicua TaxID=2527996 RepID=A0A5C6FFM0_9PLAN|nr:hypothetical protein [Crateriforma conspicua]TWU59542.1 hypothetical protein V7x_55880 [Crateriforma conspicua]
MTQIASDWQTELQYFGFVKDWQNHGMQRSGGGAVSFEINVDSRRPLIPIVTRGWL